MNELKQIDSAIALSVTNLLHWTHNKASSNAFNLILEGVPAPSELAKSAVTSPRSLQSAPGRAGGGGSSPWSGVTALPGVTEPRLGPDNTVGLLMLLSTRRRALLKLTNADPANIVR